MKALAACLLFLLIPLHCHAYTPAEVARLHMGAFAIRPSEDGSKALIIRHAKNGETPGDVIELLDVSVPATPKAVATHATGERQRRSRRHTVCDR